jgi:hypothetical protein
VDNRLKPARIAYERPLQPVTVSNCRDPLLLSQLYCCGTMSVASRLRDPAKHLEGRIPADQAKPLDEPEFTVIE